MGVVDNEGAVEECILSVTRLLRIDFEGEFERHQSSDAPPSTDKSGFQSMKTLFFCVRRSQEEEKKVVCEVGDA